MEVFTIEEFAEYAGMEIDEVESGKVRLLEREALALIGTVCRNWQTMNPIPDEVAIVALRVVKRAYGRDGLDGVSSQQTSAGPFSQTVSWSDSASSGGVWLSRADKALLRSVCGGGGAAYAINLIPSHADGRGVEANLCKEWLW